MQVVRFKLASLIAVCNKRLRSRHRPTCHRRVTVSGAVYDIRTCRQIKHIDASRRPTISCKQTARHAQTDRRLPPVNIQRLLILSHRRRPCRTVPRPHSSRISCHRPLPAQLDVGRTVGPPPTPASSANSRDDARDNAVCCLLRAGGLYLVTNRGAVGGISVAAPTTRNDAILFN